MRCRARPAVTRPASPASSATSAQPADAALELKPGAKVMMLTQRSRQALGQRHRSRACPRLTDKQVWVEIDGREYEVEQVVLGASPLRLRPDARKRSSRRWRARSSSFPLRLAWALTIHKAQGLTLDKVYVDLGRRHLRARPDLCRFVALPDAGGPGAGPPPDARRHPVRPRGDRISRCFSGTCVD